MFLGVQSLFETETGWSDCTDVGLIASERAIWHIAPRASVLRELSPATTGVRMRCRKHAHKGRELYIAQGT
jgi:hypothetical protein